MSYLGPHDDARMNLLMTISAVRHGGSLVNYTELIELQKSKDENEKKKNTTELSFTIFFFLSYLGPHDDARMNLSMTISAVRHGGSLVNYTEQ